MTLAGVPANAWFRSPTTISLTLDGMTSDVELGDLDGDGDLDAVVSCYCRRAIQLLLNDGSGHFTTAAAAFSNRPTEVVVLVDVDADGDLDIFEGDLVLDGQAGYLWLNDGSAGFSPATQVFPGPANTAAAKLDIEGDGDPDLLFGGADGSVSVWTNQGGVQAGTPGTFVAGQTISAPPTPSPIVDMAVADVDNDGDEDAAWIIADEVHFWVNQSGNLSLHQSLPARLAQALAFGHLNTDAFPDLAIAQFLGGGFWAIGVGGGSFQSSFRRFPPGNGVDIAIADLDGLGSMDVLLAGPPASQTQSAEPESQLNAWLNFGNGIDFEHRWQCFGRGPGEITAIALGDLDDDGDNDLVFTRSGLAHEFGVYLNGPLGTAEGCCPAEAAQRVTASTGEAPKTLPVGMGASLSDLPALRRLRDEIMRSRVEGARLAEAYQSLTPDLLAVMLQDILLTLSVNVTLSRWQASIDALLAGNGAGALITAGQIAPIDPILDDFFLQGSPSLAQFIAAERARLQPLSQFVGMDMDSFAAIVLGPPDILFADGWEGLP